MINQPGKKIILTAAGIKKSFNHVEVLHGVDFTLRKGEVHGLVGQNGAGKSTLMKIINGVYSRDEGSIVINNQEATYDTPTGANAHGIAMVFQEFSLVPTMTVAKNLFLAHEECKGGLLDNKSMLDKAKRLFIELGVDIEPNMMVSRLPVGSRQIVEIAKAISHNASILIMDEPTASLSNIEIQSLFILIKRLKGEGISIIFVSHHLNEVVEICDWVTVIRDGSVALSEAVANAGLENIITAMIGKKLDRQQTGTRGKIERNHPLLEVSGLSFASLYQDVNFAIYPGEVLGIAGVLGSGRSELLKSLYGVLHPEKGEITLGGKKTGFNHPAEAIKAGIILVPEDRRKNGVFYSQSVRNNILQSIWTNLVGILFINNRKGDQIVNHYVHELNIRATSIHQMVQRLSGGNQQKVVFARSLASGPKILLLDDPTVGVDIETKKEIANIIRQIAADGNGVILVSSEMDEVADLCDRVLVIKRGRIIDEIDSQQTIMTEESLLHAIQ